MSRNGINKTLKKNNSNLSIADSSKTSQLTSKIYQIPEINALYMRYAAKLHLSAAAPETKVEAVAANVN